MDSSIGPVALSELNTSQAWGMPFQERSFWVFSNNLKWLSAIKKGNQLPVFAPIVGVPP